MSLDDCFNQHKGTAVLVPGGGAGNNGQCAQWADTVLHDVYGLPYVFTPAAKDWWYNFDSFPQLKGNFDKIPRGQPIKKGDFIFYDPLSANDPQGHVDVASKDSPNVNSFTAYDSNWDATNFYQVINGVKYPALHEVVHADGFNGKVIGYARKKGTNMKPQRLATAGMIKDFAHSYGWEPDANYLKNWVGQDAVDCWYDLSGQPAVLNAVKAKYGGTSDADAKIAQIKAIIG